MAETDLRRCAGCIHFRFSQRWTREGLGRCDIFFDQAAKRVGGDPNTVVLVRAEFGCRLYEHRPAIGASDAPVTFHETGRSHLGERESDG